MAATHQAEEVHSARGLRHPLLRSSECALGHPEALEKATERGTLDTSHDTQEAKRPLRNRNANSLQCERMGFLAEELVRR